MRIRIRFDVGRQSEADARRMATLRGALAKLNAWLLAHSGDARYWDVFARAAAIEEEIQRLRSRQ